MFGFIKLVVENDVIGDAETGIIGCETTGVTAMDVPGLFDFAAFAAAFAASAAALACAFAAAAAAAAAAFCCLAVNAGATNAGAAIAGVTAGADTTGAAATTAVGDAAIGVSVLASEEGCNEAKSATRVVGDVVVPLPTKDVVVTGWTGEMADGPCTAGAGALVTGLMAPPAD